MLLFRKRPLGLDFLVLVLLLAANTVRAQSSLECRALSCLTSPYGPGMAPGCEEPMAKLRSAMVRGEGLPVCENVNLSIRQRDYSSHWYWKSMGWEGCNGDFATTETPHACGNAVHESLPVHIEFEIASYETLTPRGETALATLVNALEAHPQQEFLSLRLVGVWMSRRDYASEALAAERASTVGDLLSQRFPGQHITEEAVAENQVTHKSLRHGVEISVIGRDVRPDRTITGNLLNTASSCGTVEIETGSIRLSIQHNLNACGYQIGEWELGTDGHIDDYLETQHTVRRVGDTVDAVLAYFQAVYSLESLIDDTRVNFKRSEKIVLSGEQHD